MNPFVDTSLRCPAASDPCALGQTMEDGGGRTLAESAVKLRIERRKTGVNAHPAVPEHSGEPEALTGRPRSNPG